MTGQVLHGIAATAHAVREAQDTDMRWMLGTRRRSPWAAIDKKMATRVRGGQRSFQVLRSYSRIGRTVRAQGRFQAYGRKGIYGHARLRQSVEEFGVVRSEEVKHFYIQYGAEVQRYLTRQVKCGFTAADLTQEVFLRLVRSGNSMELSNPRAYIYRIASNILTDHIRGAARKHSASHEPISDTVAEEAPGPEDRLLSRDELMRLERAIADLPQRQREVMTLHKFDGLSYRDIADRLGISKNTVMVHMMRALAHCRDRLADD